ncbi:hypothetical protein RYX36_026027, partial [Vicia faba]
MSQTPEKQVMVVDINDKDYSTYTLEWSLNHLFTTVSNHIFKLVLVYAKPFGSASVGII